MPERKVPDIVEFAREVERFCDFFLDDLSASNSRDGSPDVMVLEKLKDNAAEIQTYYDKETKTGAIRGLDSYMTGLKEKT